ncbi:hypothetical protein LOTGIDRAFT_202405 [Lottia gigantea]|uniref:NADH dehydrogenase [ubiquinone] 1 beta subcomplex subunit 11, mitochondrial n=1 Tax=Lottia gigantea TaxID=225164 RepID=V4AMV8_LOTGI|nr:hypothetical protein LOTGIDRAFT_202405 [Lottia gigantea]ESO94936.1 hypothetical protein LOTGIDRAFT_202405 [Lottia gigantea]
MAGLLRTISGQGRILTSLGRLQPSSFSCTCIRTISTSKNKKETTIGAIQPMPNTKDLKKLEEHFADDDPTKDKNWISAGISYTDKEMDTFVYQGYAAMLSLIFVAFGFVLYYQPDHLMQDWALREAYLEIEHREKNGLPLVDPNLIPLDQISLPDESEIQDINIII